MEQKRLVSGIDIVKITAMFLVTFLHVTGVGGAILGQSSVGLRYFLGLLQSVSICCINLFALSTGFLRYNRDIKVSSLFSIRLQALFWLCVTYSVIAVYKHDFSVITDNILQIFCMDRMNTYWYVTEYSLLFFFMPILDLAVKHFSAAKSAAIITVILLFTSVSPTAFPQYDIVHQGYSFAWLGIMYIIGAYIKKYDIIHKINTKLCIAVFSVFIFIESIYAFASNSFHLEFISGMQYNKNYMYYNCFFIVVASVLLFLLLSRIDVKSKKIGTALNKICSVSFSVYLIQCSPIIFQNYIAGKFTFLGSYTAIKSVCAVFGITTAIFVAGLVLGSIQNKLFKIFRIYDLCVFAERVLKKWYLQIFGFSKKILWK